MADTDDPNIVATLDPAFEAGLARATTVFWSPGRCIILIVDGREQEFDCRKGPTEERMLALLRDHGTPILDEAGPRRVVSMIAVAGLAALALLAFMI